ncbi:hypothetical protein [Ensifer adhaerens]|uniref:hypothetical protein n=1 Tax=Ensifer adhaerens TaxID=106592 RepID=UPI0018F85DCB|nr:hypothetical protein [Ensifer adhaerens]
MSVINVRCWLRSALLTPDAAKYKRNLPQSGSHAVRTSPVTCDAADRGLCEDKQEKFADVGRNEQILG